MVTSKDAQTGTARTLSRHAQVEGVHGEISHELDPMIATGRFHLWFHGDFEQVREFPIHDLLEHPDGIQFDGLGEDGRTIRISHRYESSEGTPFRDVRTIWMDPERGFLPLRMHQRWDYDLPSGKPFYSDTKTEVMKIAEVEGVWFPTHITLIATGRPSVEKKYATVDETTVGTIKLGTLTDEDLLVHLQKTSRSAIGARRSVPRVQICPRPPPARRSGRARTATTAPQEGEPGLRPERQSSRLLRQICSVFSRNCRPVRPQPFIRIAIPSPSSGAKAIFATELRDSPRYGLGFQFASSRTPGGEPSCQNDPSRGVLLPRMSILMRLVLVSLAIGCSTSTEPTETVSRVGRVASFDGLEIAYTERGVGPRTLVFVHGWTCDRSDWDEQIEAFGDEGHVVAIDMAGHGASGGGRSQWDLATLARDVTSVVTALELEDVVLVGHSLGGPVTLLAAAAMPERTSLVVGIDTLHDCANPPEPGSMQGLVDGLEADFEGAMASFIESLSGSELSPERMARMQQRAVRMDPAHALPLLRDYVSYDSRAALRACGAPVHVINTRAYATNVEASRTLAPSFEATYIESTGHWPMLDRAAEVNRVLAELLAHPR